MLARIRTQREEVTICLTCEDAWEVFLGAARQFVAMGLNWREEMGRTYYKPAPRARPGGFTTGGGFMK